MLEPLSLPDAFSAADCALVCTLAATAPAREAGLVGGARNHGIRQAGIVWLDGLDGALWVMDRLVEVTREANRTFGFDLDGFDESPQVARYAAGGHFDWHTDTGSGPLARRRKLTVVVQVSDPARYDGGSLETLAGPAPRTASRDQGTATVFPSFVLHRVTPVTAGERLSLTVWAHGPSFR